MIDKLPPQNIEAEEATLGACILDSDALEKALAIVRFDNFYNQHNKMIMKIMEEMNNKGLTVDLVTLQDTLKNTMTRDKYGKETDITYLEAVGGYMHLLDLSESVPTTANVEKYATIVKECSIRREMIKVGHEIIALGYNQETDLQTVLNDSENKVCSLSQMSFTSDFKLFSDLVEQEFQEMKKAREENITKPKDVIPTGITELDEQTGGGLNPSDLIIVAARPGIGKTSFVLNIGANIAREFNLPIPVFSLEMEGKQLTQRVISSEAEVNNYHIRTRIMTDSIYQDLERCKDMLKSLPILIDDKTDINMNEIRSKCRKLKSQYGKLGPVIIDYLQLMDIDDNDLEARAIGKITRAAKKLAKEINAPVILLSQLNRAVEQRQDKRPNLSDLKSSSSIEQDADMVMFLYRDEYYNPDTDKKRIAECNIAKFRNGAAGMVELYFDGTLTKFSGLERGV